VIYGKDGRIELREFADDALREVFARSVAAVMISDALKVDHDSARLLARSLEEVAGLCPGERFATQPAAAQCSALLLDSRTLLTAGHCMRRIACADALFVFGYANGSDGKLPRLAANDVYRCESVLVRELSVPTASQRIDFAWVRIDRPAPDRAAFIEVRGASDPLQAGEALTVAGFGGGVPMQVISGGQVADPRAAVRDYFVSTSDTIQGDSGAPVFDAQRRLVGVHVRGYADYMQTADGCQVSSQLDDSIETAAEQNTYAARALDELCAAHPEAEACCLQDASCKKRLEPHAAPGCSTLQGLAREPVEWRACLLGLFFRFGRRARRRHWRSRDPQHL
jgi:hypothetical protein